MSDNSTPPAATSGALREAILALRGKPPPLPHPSDYGSYELGFRDARHAAAGLAASAATSDQLIADCAPYLKEGETPAECIQRNRKDTESVLRLLVREKEKTESAASAAIPQTQEHPARMLTDEEIDGLAAQCGIEITRDPMHHTTAQISELYAFAHAVLAAPVGEQVHPDTKDAMRYRFLRDTGDATWRPFGIRAGYSAAQADAAIDAAIQGGNPTEGRAAP